MELAAIQLSDTPCPIILFYVLLPYVLVCSGLPSSIPSDTGMTGSAYLITAQVATAKARFGIHEVDIMAHSRGGLGAQHYSKTANTSMASPTSYQIVWSSTAPMLLPTLLSPATRKKRPSMMDYKTHIV